MQDQLDYYDRRWREFSYANLFCLERCIFFLQSLQRLGLEQPRICDLGSGSGWLSGVLSSFGPVLGVELSPEAVKSARERYPKADFLEADATTWEPEPHSFDVVVSQEVIEHIPDKLAYLQVVRRALKPGGYLLMTTPNLKVLEAVPKEERETVWEIQPIELPVSRQELTGLLTGAGFDVISTSSAVDQIGKSGLHRLVNSHKLRTVLNTLGLHQPWKNFLLNHDFGMYLLTVARSR